MQSTNHVISLPVELIKRIDTLIEETNIDTNRSAMIKFCATYKTPRLTITQEAASIALAELMESRSKNKMQSIALRSRHPFDQTEDTLMNICRCLVYLGFYGTISGEDAIF